MTTQETPKHRNVAWHRAMKGHRRDAIALLDKLGPNADHLPGSAQKAEHKAIVSKLKRVVQVIEQHLREARPDKPSPRPQRRRTR
jgi:hypothetical protein